MEAFVKRIRVCLRVSVNWILITVFQFGVEINLTGLVHHLFGSPLRLFNHYFALIWLWLLEALHSILANILRMSLL